MSAHLARPGSRSLGQAGHGQFAIHLGRAGDAALAPAVCTPRLLPGRPACWLQTRRIWGTWRRLAVEAGRSAHIDEVHQPAVDRAPALRAGTDAAIERGARGGGQLTRQAALVSAASMLPAAGPWRSGVRVNGAAGDLGVDAVQVLGQATGFDQALGKQRAAMPSSRKNIAAGADGVVLVGLGGGLGAARVDDDQPPPRARRALACRGSRAPSTCCRWTPWGWRRG